MEQMAGVWLWNLSERLHQGKKTCVEVTVTGMGAARLAQGSGLKSRKEDRVQNLGECPEGQRRRKRIL